MSNLPTVSASINSVDLVAQYKEIDSACRGLRLTKATTESGLVYKRNIAKGETTLAGPGALVHQTPDITYAVSANNESSRDSQLAAVHKVLPTLTQEIKGAFCGGMSQPTVSRKLAAQKRLK